MTTVPGSLCRAAACAAIAALCGIRVQAQAPSTPAPAQGESSSLADAPSPAPAKALPASSLRPSGNAKPLSMVTVLEDTDIQVMTVAPLNSKQAEQDTPVLFTVSQDVMVGDVLAIPRGATVHGVVLKSRKAGVLTGSPELTLKLVSLDLGDKNYPIYTYQFKVTGTSKTPATQTKALAGAYAGAVAGSFLSGISEKGGVQTSTGTSRAASMGAGAAVGAGVGTLVSAATPGPGIWIPSESQIDFFLAAPITIKPLSAKEAAKLSEGLHAGGPVLYVRGETP